MSNFYRGPSDYIYRKNPDGFDPIVGRVYGQDRPGMATYQLAARPFDEMPQHGHDSKDLAFEAAVKELERRELVEHYWTTTRGHLANALASQARVIELAEAAGKVTSEMYVAADALLATYRRVTELHRATETKADNLLVQRVVVPSQEGFEGAAA